MRLRSRSSIIALLENFLRRIEQFRIPVMAGIWPLVSLRNAEFMKNELRVSVPDAILQRMSARVDSRKRRARKGLPWRGRCFWRSGRMVQGAQSQCSPGAVCFGCGCAGGAGGLKNLNLRFCPLDSGMIQWLFAGGRPRHTDQPPP